MDPAAAKQQIVERVKQASKFLVTVNANPSIDQLAACIGLTLMINKMGKLPHNIPVDKPVPGEAGFQDGNGRE